MTITAPAFSGVYKVPVPSQLVPKLQDANQAAERELKNVTSSANSSDNQPQLSPATLQNLMAAMTELSTHTLQSMKKLVTNGAKVVKGSLGDNSQTYYLYTDDSLQQVEALAQKVRKGEMSFEEEKAELKKLQDTAQELII